MSTSEFSNWSGSWAAGRNLQRLVATSTFWRVAQPNRGSAMSNTPVAPSVSSSFSTCGALQACGGIALGLGLTNECNLKCAFCYRDPDRADRLSLDQVKAVMERLPVRSV